MLNIGAQLARKMVEFSSQKKKKDALKKTELKL